VNQYVPLGEDWSEDDGGPAWRTRRHTDRHSIEGRAVRAVRGVRFAAVRIKCLFMDKKIREQKSI
jgi:hypothetical protein